MKREILFISYYSPFIRTVASIRIENMIRQLIKHNWNVTLLSPDEKYFHNIDDKINIENLNIIRTSFITKLLSGIEKENKALEYLSRGLSKLSRTIGFEPETGWLYDILNYYKKYAMNINFAICSGGPFVSFIAAYLIKKYINPEFKYMLDYRDLWNGNPHNRYTLFSHIESKILKNASGIFAVSPSMVQILSRYNDKCYLITNGFNKKDIENIITEKRSEITNNLVYAGTFYKDLRTIDPLFRSIKLLKEEGIDIIFDFYGSQVEYVKNKGKIYGISGNIRCFGNRHRNEVLRALFEAMGVVVIINSNKESNLFQDTIITGKIFECIALNRNVLVIAPKSSDSNKILEEIGYEKAIPGNEILQINNRIKFYMNNRERIIDYNLIKKYEWDSIGSSLNQYLLDICGK